MKNEMLSIPLGIFLLLLTSSCAIGKKDARSAKNLFGRAQWIWCEGDPVPQNFYLYCRQSVDLGAGLRSAEVHVTADSRYKLFVNGEFVGRGPARYDQRWQSYDTYDILPFLQEGENVISAIVHQYGVEIHSYVLGRGGFFLQGEVVAEDGGRVGLGTDGWSCWSIMWHSGI